MRHIKIVVQYRLPKNIDALVQRIGRAGRDPSIQAIAILLVEKSYFSKSQLERWTEKFKNAPKIPSRKRAVDSALASPRKRRALGETINTIHPTPEGILEESPNEELSPEATLPWARTGADDGDGDVDGAALPAASGPSTDGIRYEEEVGDIDGGDNVGDDENGEWGKCDEGVESGGMANQWHATLPVLSNSRESKPLRKRKAAKDDLDCHLAAFLYVPLLAPDDPRGGCR